MEFFKKNLLTLLAVLLMPVMVFAQPAPVPLLDCAAAQQLCDMSPINVPNGVWGPGNYAEPGTCMLTGETSSHWYVFTCTQSGTFNFTCTPNGAVDYDFAFFNITGSAPGTCNISAATQLVCNYALTTGVTGIGCGVVGCTPTQNLVAGNTYAILINRYTAGSVIGFNLTFSGTAQIGAPQSSISATAGCLGTATQFTINNNPASGVVYNWNFGDGNFSAQANPTHTYQNAGTYNVTLQITSTSGNACLNQNLSTTVTVNEAPGISVLPATQTVCPGQVANLSVLTNPPTPAAIYTWSPSASLSSSTGSSITANPSQNTTYTVTVSDGNGCTNSATTIVNIGSNLSINVSAVNSSICPGSQTTLNVNGADTYTWSPAASLNATTGTSVTASPTVTTTYTVTGTDANGCTASATIPITVLPLPNMSITPASPTICIGQSVSLTASGASIYSWAPNTNLSANTGATVSANPNVNSTYTVTGTSAAGCTASQTVAITVVNLPSISVTPNNPFVCSGAAAQMTAGGADTYTWSPSTYLSATSGTVVSADPPVTTTYTVVGTLSSGCTGSTNVVVSVGNNPTVTVNPSSSLLCDGSNINITAFGAATYTWSPASSLNNATASSVIANPFTNTTYTVVGTAANGCTASATSAITLTQAQPVTLSSTASIICPGNQIILTAEGSGNYTWSPAGGTSQGNTYIVAPNSSTTYTVNAIDAQGCSATASIAINVLSPPPVSVTNNNALICEGDFTTLTANGAVSYTWSPATNLSSTTGNPVLANPAVTTTYTVNGIDANGCSANASVVVNVDPFPIAAFSIDQDKGCNPLNVVFTNNSQHAVSYAWFFDNGQISQSANATALYNTGVYYPWLIATNTAGCSDTALLGTGITVYPPPIADFSSTPDTGVLMKYTEALVSFTNLSQGATSYAWNFSDGTTSSETNPVHQFLSKGEYMVRLTATSDQGCTAEKVRGPYLVEGMPPVYVPNSFTPNNDGLNDVFKVYAIGLKEFDLKVFDRWGTQVFNSNDITIGWDGTFNGKPMNAGVYIYQLRAILQNDDPLLKYGDVNLLR